MLEAVVAAVSAAALFAVAAALQHRSAGLVTAAGQGAGAAPAGFVSGTLRNPLWIVGSVAGLAGLGLHALALRSGPLTLIQPLLVTGVIFALPLRQVLEHHRPRRAELGWAAALALSLAGFLVIATPAGVSARAADLAPAVICAAAIAAVLSGCLAVGCRMRGTASAMTLGAGAGLAFAASAGLLKETVDALSRGPVALVLAWPGYAAAAAGAAGLMLSQLAYRAGPLRASLPVITAVNPLISLVIGVAVFDEPFRTGPGYLVGETVGLALLAAATIGITRSAPG
jgi:drug/metabolite transporter (DMT)-like permease